MRQCRNSPPILQRTSALGTSPWLTQHGGLATCLVVLQPTVPIFEPVTQPKTYLPGNPPTIYLPPLDSPSRWNGNPRGLGLRKRACGPVCARPPFEFASPDFTQEQSSPRVCAVLRSRRRCAGPPDQDPGAAQASASAEWPAAPCTDSSCARASPGRTRPSCRPPRRPRSTASSWA